MYNLINGRKIADKIKQDLKNKVAKLKKKPGLAIVLVGKNPASKIYVKLKEKAAQEIGFRFLKYLLPANIKLIKLIRLIKKLNKDKKVHGIVVQFPLPSHLDADRVVEAIESKKDVDGFHPENIKLLKQGKPRLIPGVLAGITKLLESTKAGFKNKKFVILSNCKIFAQPLEILLKRKGLKAKTFYSPLKNYKIDLKKADLVISALGRPRFIKGNMIKSNSILIDVGFTRIKGKAVGDFDFDSCVKKAGYITPVPGGVGPMTVVMLLENVYGLSKK